jgi:hypothetical protein
MTGIKMPFFDEEHFLLDLCKTLLRHTFARGSV